MESKKITLGEIDEMLKPFKNFTKDVFIAADSEMREAVRKMLDDFEIDRSCIEGEYLRYGIKYNNPYFNNPSVRKYELDVISFYRNGLYVFFGDWNTLLKLQDKSIYEGLVYTPDFSKEYKSLEN